MDTDKLYSAMLQDQPDLLTVKDVQRILGIGRVTVYQMIDEHQLRGVRAGKKYIIPKYSVIEYLAGTA